MRPPYPATRRRQGQNRVKLPRMIKVSDLDSNDATILSSGYDKLRRPMSTRVRPRRLSPHPGVENKQSTRVGVICLLTSIHTIAGGGD